MGLSIHARGTRDTRPSCGGGGGGGSDSDDDDKDGTMGPYADSGEGSMGLVDASDYGESGTSCPDGLDLDLSGRNACGDGSDGDGGKDGRMGLVRLQLFCEHCALLLRVHRPLISDFGSSPKNDDIQKTCAQRPWHLLLVVGSPLYVCTDHPCEARTHHRCIASTCVAPLCTLTTRAAARSDNPGRTNTTTCVCHQGLSAIYIALPCPLLD